MTLPCTRANVSLQAPVFGIAGYVQRLNPFRQRTARGGVGKMHARAPARDCSTDAQNLLSAVSAHAHLQLSTSPWKAPSSGGDGTSPSRCVSTMLMLTANGRRPGGTLHSTTALLGACSTAHRLTACTDATAIVSC